MRFYFSFLLLQVTVLSGLLLATLCCVLYVHAQAEVITAVVCASPILPPPLPTPSHHSFSLIPPLLLPHLSITTLPSATLTTSFTKVTNKPAFVNIPITQGSKLTTSLSRQLIVLTGWLWTTTSIIGMLPLFSMPVFHAVESFYCQSVFFGPVLRAISRFF